MSTRPWFAPVLIGVALLAAIAGGYLLGNANASTEQDAAAARAESARSAFTAAQVRSYARAFDNATDAGTLAGKIEGRRVGADDGAVAGLRATQKQLDDAALTGSGGAGRDEGEAVPGGPVLPSPSIPGGNVTGGVLVVGDSLEVLTSPYLKKYLPADQLTINAVGGYSSLQIFGLFQESYDPSQAVVVFDAGTNDNPSYPEILAGRLNAVAKIVGDERCMVVPTIHGLSVDGVDSTGKNRVVDSFAAARPATVTPDWAGFVATHPELMQPDNLHPTAEGADARAQLIAEGVDACFSFGAGSSDLIE